MTPNRSALDTISKYINQSQYNFVGPVVFLGIILIAFLMGIWNGRKTVIYFLVGNIAALLIAIIVLQFGWEKIMSMPFIKDIKIGTFNFKTILDNNSALIKTLFGGLFIIASMLVFTFLMFIIYLFIRKSKLKDRIIENREVGISNIPNRVQGGMIAIILSLPYAAILGSYGAVMGNNETMHNVFAKMTYGVTVLQVNDVSKNVTTLVESSRSVLDIMDSGNSLGAIFGSAANNSDDLEKLLSNPDTRRAVETIVNSDFIINNFDLVIDSLPADQFNGIDLTATGGQLPNTTPVADNLSVNVTAESFAKLTKNIGEAITKRGGNASLEGVQYFFTASNLLKIAA